MERVYCPTGHLVGVIKENGAIEIRHKKRIIEIQAVSGINVSITCDVCGQRTCIKLPPKRRNCK